MRTYCYLVEYVTYMCWPDSSSTHYFVRALTDRQDMAYSIRTTISWANLFIDIQPALYTRKHHCQQASLECCMTTLVVDPQNYGYGKVAKKKTANNSNIKSNKEVSLVQLQNLLPRLDYPFNHNNWFVTYSSRYQID